MVLFCWVIIFLRSRITRNVSSGFVGRTSPLPENSKSWPRVISVAVVPFFRRLYCLVTLLNSEGGEKSVVVIVVVAPCVFVGDHSGSLPSGGAAIGPWLASARHTTHPSFRYLRFNLYQHFSNNLSPHVTPFERIQLRRRPITPDCKTGASVYTLEYSQVPSYETRYSSFGIVSESPCYVLP